jgi:O-antigen ligase
MYSEFIFVLLIAVVGLKVLIDGKIPKSKLYIFLAMFISWWALSTFWAVDITYHMARFNTLVKLVFLCIVYYLIFSEQGSLDKFVTAYIIAGYTMCFYTLYVYGGWNSFVAAMSSERIAAVINQANIFGYYAALTVCFSFYLAFYKGKAGFYILMLVPLIMALGSGSKRAVIIILLGVVLLTYLKNRNKKLGKTIIYVSGVALCFYGIMQIPLFSVISERMESLVNFWGNTGYVDSSTINRQIFIDTGWGLFLKRPIGGYGLNYFSYLYNTYSHNNYIEMLVSGGIIGLFSYYILVLNPFARLYKNTLNFDRLSTLFFVVLCIGFFNDIGVVSYYDKLQFIIIGVCFACADTNYRNTLKQKNGAAQKLV